MDRHQRRHLLLSLRRDAERIATHFGLHYKSIEAERANVQRRYGVCYEDGLIKIRLAHAVTGKPLKYSSLIDTLCHELAHLKHFNHGPEFKRFFLQLLRWARQQGIYQPGRSGAETRGAEKGRSAAPTHKPERRNGIAVFRAESIRSAEQPPWERWAQVLGVSTDKKAAARERPPRLAGSSRRSRTREPVQPAQDSPEKAQTTQLTLF